MDRSRRLVNNMARSRMTFFSNLSLPDELFDRTGLQEYLLYAAQHPMGGLRDKPPKYDI